jgi:hypothetical protein
MTVRLLPIRLPTCLGFAQKLMTDISRLCNRHRLCVNRRVDKGRTYKRLRKSDIEFLWIQLEKVLEHGKTKNAKTKFELLRRMYQTLDKTVPKNK